MKIPNVWFMILQAQIHFKFLNYLRIILNQIKANKQFYSLLVIIEKIFVKPFQNFETVFFILFSFKQA